MSASSISFEIFPPRDDKAWKTLRPAMKELADYNPAFVSVTYGAGGSSRPATLETLKWLTGESRLTAGGHLTCVGAPRSEIDAVVKAYRELDVHHVVALRGDMPGGPEEAYVPHPEGYGSTADLIRGIREIGEFDISVSAYPEKHPHSPDFETDLDVLAAKADAGANRAITQFFFDNDYFYRFRDRVAARGIDINLVPGVLPIGAFPQVSKFAARCQSTIPQRVADKFDGLDPKSEMHRLVAAAVAAEQVDDLSANGVEEFHFYTLNQAPLTIACCRMLGRLPSRVTTPPASAGQGGGEQLASAGNG
ncbi:methylenetetrahydrofolate reductase [NAD(P)H] [Tepidamorphus sp. 3E244]|uniref:methylenetetrahydrofolate reductase [NAD(P)H] n=1 Tax=Tepidamorphus sp. 3E244 TaxID=3385498 RepID=UPI0038FC25BD